jgi:MFS family permease
LPSGPTSDDRYRRTAIAVLASCFAFNMFGRGMGDSYAVFLLPLEREFEWTRAQLTSVYSLYLLVSAFAAPLVGLVFDRVGPRAVYGAGLACMGTAFALAGTLTALWQFYVLIGALVGIAAALTGMVPASALLSRWYRARLSTAIGVAFSAVGIGAITFVPLAQSLIQRFGWRGAYFGLGTFLLVLAPVVAFALPWGRFARGNPAYRADAGQKSGEGGWTLRAALRTRIYWGMVQAFFCTATAMFAVLVQLVALFVDAGFSALAAATAYGITGMLSAVSVTGSGLLSDRYGYRQTVSASFVGTAAGMAILLVLTGWPSAALLVLFVPVFGLCMGVRGPIISSICARHFAGASVATIYGTIYASNALGAAFGSLLGGLLHDMTGGYRAGLVTALAFIALAAAPFWTVPALRHFK